MIIPASENAGARAPRVNGKFLDVDGRRFLVKGVAYGTFAPDASGSQFPAADRVEQDFGLMAAAGINTVRTYTVPSERMLDQAARHGLRLMIGMPWAQHVAFLDDAQLKRGIRSEAVATVKQLAAHPAALLFSLGNEIPPSVVRWYGQQRIERFLCELAQDVKAAAPESLLTYVNFPPTEYLDLDCFDVCAFNVYLHRQSDLRAYLARLQHIAGYKPLLLAEAGADSIREGGDGQAEITAMHLRTAFGEGACGTIAFSWTDEWWRGGHDVEDWAFGLVDSERKAKPALAAVQQVYSDLPYPAEASQRWPKVSVVVCAYNAESTLHDCLGSLQALTYPHVEVIVVNDGSRDSTSAIAHQYVNARVIDIANGGLSAARNVGLHHATGEIVAYTDADVRVDPDWLTYLVQPMLSAEFSGSGGPNVIPQDDPWVAQCVARAPGGPTHVLLDDRVAEHVPGCNMAFRRDALLSIGGFNPVYLRAGDDVDVCWRLQAKGYRIGFAPSALVWHHHRPSVKAYWKQQVGYGEGETWLDAHHPEKFIGGQMLWRGRIYSPLPFVRSLSRPRVNTGVWGTAAFPSVYRTDAHPLQFVPHSPAWMLACTLLLLAGAVAMVTPYVGAAWLLVGSGLAGWAVTLGRCAIFARRSDLSGLPAIDGLSPSQSRSLYRTMIGMLHLLQPVARMYGRIRGVWSPPQVLALEHVTRVPWKAPVPALGDAAASTLLLLGAASERSFWSETWTSHGEVMTELTGVLRASRPARPVGVDEGWRPDRDLSLAVGRWGWIHLRALVEEHVEGRILLRVGTRLRPSVVGVVQSLLLAVVLVAMTSAAIALRWPSISIMAALAVVGIFARAAWQTTRVAALLDRALNRVTVTAGMIPMTARSGAPARSKVRLRPQATSQIVQAGIVAAIAVSAGISSTSVVRDFVARRVTSEAATVVAAVRPEPTARPVGGVVVTSSGDIFVADQREGIIRRLRQRPADAVRAAAIPLANSQQISGVPVSFEGAADIAVTPEGHLYVADLQNNRICRIDRPSGKIVTVAGSGAAGFSSEATQATQSALDGPSGVALARNGDLFIADTGNNRIRKVSQATGLITTVAGDGRMLPGSIGDGGVAIHAQLNRPAGVAVAANGDLYIADTGHHRVRRVDARTGIITTVAGSGTEGETGDGGPAAEARLSTPMGLALVPMGKRVVIYVADSGNDRVRVVGPDGGISTLGGTRRFATPTRVAYHPGGWLYVKDSSPAGVTSIAVSKPSQFELASVPRPPASRKTT